MQQYYEERELETVTRYASLDSDEMVAVSQYTYDGFTSDELFFARATIGNYSQALWLLRNPENRLVYTWIVGRPGISSLHTDSISTCLNTSRGRGRLLFEAYCHPQDNEEAAAAYPDNMIGETMRRFNAYFPNAAAGTGVIFGNFNQIPIISLEHNRRPWQEQPRPLGQRQCR